MPDDKVKNHNIDFVPSNAYRSASSGQQLFRFITNRGKTIIVLTEAIVLLVFLSRFSLDRQVADLTESIDNKNAIVESSRTIENEFREKQEKVKTVKTLIDDQVDWSYELDTFDGNVPQGMVLQSIDYSNTDTNLSAKVNSAEAFAIFISNMISDESVDSIILQSSSYNTEEKIYTFSMNVIRNQTKQ